MRSEGIDAPAQPARSPVSKQLRPKWAQSFVESGAVRYSPFLRDWSMYTITRKIGRPAPMMMAVIAPVDIASNVGVIMPIRYLQAARPAPTYPLMK